VALQCSRRFSSIGNERPVPDAIVLSVALNPTQPCGFDNGVPWCARERRDSGGAVVRGVGIFGRGGGNGGGVGDRAGGVGVDGGDDGNVV